MSIALAIPVIDGEKGDYFMLYFVIFGIMNVILAINYSRNLMNHYLVLDYFPGFRSMKKHIFCCLEMKRNWS